jgi:transcriptional regulator of acetoin/glycerol metabolism
VEKSAAAAVAALRNQHPIFLWIQAHADRAIIPLEQAKREHIERALILCRGDIELAAERLGLSRRTLFRWLRRYREKDCLPPVPIRD